MPKTLSSIRDTPEVLAQIERAEGVTAPSTVLMLLALYRAAERTIRAQKEVIAEHARTIGDLRKKAKS